MGTVKKIIDNLQRLCDDKKAQADRRYEDHSAWLRSEFVQIHRLLKGMDIEPDSVVEEAPREAPVTKSQKRKSPEISQNSSRSSPLTKRTAPSPTFEDVAPEVGLPKDLNRLTKDQLLSELEKRGCVTMTMKALKKDLVETLKELVVDIASRDNSPAVLDEPEPEEPTFQPPAPVSFEAPAPVVDIASASPRDPARKGSNSTMAELRSRVVGSSGGSAPAADTSKSAAATEFEARQRRHRKSQEIRTQPPAESPAKPAMPPPAPAAEVLMSPAPKRDTEPGSAQKLPFLPVHMPVLMSPAAKQPAPAPESPQMETEAAEQENDVTEQEEVEEAAAEEEGLMEECGDSPQKASEEGQEEEAEAHPTEDAIEGTAEDPIEDAQEDAAEDVAEEDQEDAQEGEPQSDSEEGSFHSAADMPGEPEPDQPEEEPEEERELSLEELSPALKESPAPLTEPAAAAPEPKKPSNLISGGATSFFSSGAAATTSAAPKPKPVIPALQQAARLKEKEEARLLAKKRELEEKKKALTAGPFSAAPSTAGGAPAPASKSFISGIFGSKQAAGAAPGAKPAAASSSSISSVPPAPQAKKGLFGWNGATKKEMPATSSSAATANPIHKAPAPAAVAAPTPAPVAAPADENAPPQDAPRKTTTSSHPAPHPSTATSTPGILKEIPVAPRAASPDEAPPPPPPVDGEYVIEDREDSDSSDTDGEDDGAASKKKPKQEIPEWAKGPQLKAALEKQYGFHGGIAVDPDTIFTEVHTCSLEEIFGKREGKCGKYSARTSSAKWDADKLSVVDKRKYRLQMGYDKA